MNTNCGCRRRIAPIASGQNGSSFGGDPSAGSARSPPVRWMICGRSRISLSPGVAAAADAVAAVRDRAQLSDLRLPKPGLTVVELEGVRPAVEVRIAAERQDLRRSAPARRLDARIVLRRAREVVLAAVHVV